MSSRKNIGNRLKRAFKRLLPAHRSSKGQEPMITHQKATIVGKMAIYLKRLTKGVASNPSDRSPPAAPSTSTLQLQPELPRQPVVFQSKRPSEPSVTPSPVSSKKKTLAKLDLNSWEDNTIRSVLKVTLDRELAESSGYSLVWLKELASKLESEEPRPIRLHIGILDRLLIARLQLDPRSMSNDPDYSLVLASLLPQQTTFEFLVGCWKRLNTARSVLLKKRYLPEDIDKALNQLEKIRDLVINYAGLTLQEPKMFPQPAGRPRGPPELVASLLSLSALSSPFLSTASSSPDTLTLSDIEPFLQDLACRFEYDNKIDLIFGPVVRQLLFHELLSKPEGIGGSNTGWRGVVRGLEALVSIKSIAVMITRMDEWNPCIATASTFERISLFGPICRLGVFAREWPSIAQGYFSDPENRTRADIELSFSSLRGSLNSLQSSLFQIFDALVKASSESRDAVLQYFARAISLNVKRGGMQVKPETVSTDSFMVNLQAVLLRFAEPFMDANYTKMDRIDPFFYARSSRIDLKDETRINATSDEASTWVLENQDLSAPPSNFISNIFYITIAMSPCGYLRTIQTYLDLAKDVANIQRRLDMLNGDGSWMGTPIQGYTQTAINSAKHQISKVRCQQLAFETQLLDPDFVFRCVSFTTFLSTWLIRQVDPKKTHPTPPAELPLPMEVPMAFRVLPEYILKDIVDYFYFVVRLSPDKLELPGKTDLMFFVLTFLSSTWYIKNPFLKMKINDVLFMSIWDYGREGGGILGNLLNSHPMALTHLMPVMMHFYIGQAHGFCVAFISPNIYYDQRWSKLARARSSTTNFMLGLSSFLMIITNYSLDSSSRQNISDIMKVVWDNPTHRQALNAEILNGDKFVRFVHLMINDVTYLMDESLSELTQIHNIELEMSDGATWSTKPQGYRQECEGKLFSLERSASGHITLGRSTVDLLKVFTAETKVPFMVPEIVDHLAAMLDYNLDLLVDPKCQDLKVKEPELKLKFNPRALMSDILQVFVNLSDRREFITAVAGDGRSYKLETFQRAANIARRRVLKSETEINTLLSFAARAEEAKATMKADDDLGDIPEEFLDPVMSSVMRDPVMLPSSRVVIDRSTIKAHLLSDSKDPFNREPLTINDVIPDPVLKARIEAFLIERRNKNATFD